MYENAVGLLTKCTQIFPCELTFNELGKTHEKLNNFEMAERNFQLAVNYDCLHTSSTLGNVWKNLFDLYEKQKRIDAKKLCESFIV